MNNANIFQKFKIRFSNLNYYSMPEAILFVFRKRINLIVTFILTIIIVIFSLI